VPSFAHAIHGVVFSGSNEQVGWVTARGVITSMAYHHRFR